MVFRKLARSEMRLAMSLEIPCNSAIKSLPANGFGALYYRPALTLVSVWPWCDLHRPPLPGRGSKRYEARGNGARAQHPEPQRLLAVPYGRTDLSIGIWHPGAVLRAIYDPLRHHRRPGRRAAVQSHVHVLGWRDRLPADAALHGHQLQRIPGQGRENAGYGHH